MRRMIAVVCLALAPFAAAAQPLGNNIVLASPPSTSVPPAGPPPSPQAKQMAGLLNPARFITVENAPKELVAKALEQRLLTSHYAPRGAPCAAAHPECAAAARAVARDYGDRYSAWSRELITEAYAYYFDELMTPAQIASAASFLQTPAGKTFAAALREAEMPLANRPLFQRAYARLAAARAPTDGMFDAFYDRTKHLPRRPLPLAPPPMAPPAPPAPLKPPQR